MTSRFGLLAAVMVLLTACGESQMASNSQKAAELVAGGEASQAGAAESDAVSEAVSTGQAYLHINAQKPGVQVTESGLQFEILEQGDGKSPGPTSRVLTHYHGTFPNGDVFDSSLEFPLNRVIAGWTEALQMMKEGDKWRLVLPPDIAYGKKGAGGGAIPPDAVLIFEVELIKVLD